MDEIYVLVLLILLIVILSHPLEELFIAGNLAYTPVAVSVLFLSGIALLIGKKDLFRVLIITAAALVIYSTAVFPAERYLTGIRSMFLFISELLIPAELFILSFVTEGTYLAESGISCAIRDFLYPENDMVQTKTSKLVQPLQLLCLTGALVLLIAANVRYGISAPWMELLLFIAVGAGVTLAGRMIALRNYGLLIAVSMILKIVLDLRWDLTVAEGDYQGLYVLMEVLLAAAAAGGCRRLYTLISISELVLIGAVLVEY